MGGAILELVANKKILYDISIRCEPHITYYSKMYSKHIHYSIERITPQFTPIGKSISVTIYWDG